MSDLRELYQEVIIDHNRCPRNCHAMEDANRKADGFNPLCGDKITLYLKIVEGVIADVSFEGSGCAISTASASLMTEFLVGKSETEAKVAFDTFHDVLTQDKSSLDNLGKLSVLEGVKEFPARIKCATLAWHTLVEALKDSNNIASTE